MKILHVNKFFDLQGGAESYLHALMEQQRAAGHQVHALSTRAPQNLPSADASLFVKRFDMSRSEGVVEDAKKAAAFLWNREAKAAMEQAILELKPEVIHLHNVYHQLSSSILKPIRASRIPCVQTLHDVKLACPNYKMYTEGSVCERCKGGRYFEAVKHHCLSASSGPNILAALEMGMTKFFQSYERTVRLFICPSQFMSDKMTAWGEPGSKMRVVPNPVDFLEQPTAQLDGEYVLIAGRLVAEKGIDVLIQAAAKHPDIELRIAGIGPQQAMLQHLAKSLGAENIVFLGFLRKPELMAQRQHARALIMSTVMYENASLSALEAMSEGLPIIASRIGGLPELVGDDNGFLVDPQNPEALSAALAALWQLQPDQLRALGAASRARVQARHLWASHLQQLSIVYAEAGAR